MSPTEVAGMVARGRALALEALASPPGSTVLWPWASGPSRRWRRRLSGAAPGAVAAGAVFMALWALAAIIGVVEAPPLVTAAGVVAFLVVLMGGVAVARLLRA